MADNTYFGIATYNMHGFNNGSPGLLELCNNANIHIIALQEHWLHDNNVHLLNSLHPEFVGLCVSSITPMDGSILLARPQQQQQHHTHGCQLNRARVAHDACPALASYHKCSKPGRSHHNSDICNLWSLAALLIRLH